MRQYTDKCVEYVITHTVWSTLVYISGVVVLNVPKLISQFVAQFGWLNFVATILSFLSFISLFAAIWIFYKANKIRKNRESVSESTQPLRDTPPVSDEQEESDDESEDKLLSDVHFKKVTIGMYIKSYDDIEYTMKFDGTVNCDYLDEFHKHLSWTGSKYKGTRLIHCNYEAKLEDNIGNRDKPPYQMKLRFDEDIPRGERVKFSTKTFVSDDNKNMLPISSFYVKYPIDELVLELTALRGVVYGIKLKCYRDAAREVMLWSSRNANTTEAGNTKTFSFSITNPHPWQYYVLEWNFSEQY